MSQRPVMIRSASDSQASNMEPSNFVLSLPISTMFTSTLSPSSASSFSIPACAESLNALSPKEPVTRSVTFNFSPFVSAFAASAVVSAAAAVVSPAAVVSVLLSLAHPNSMEAAIAIASVLHKNFFFIISCSPFRKKLIYSNYPEFPDNFSCSSPA